MTAGRSAPSAREIRQTLAQSAIPAEPEAAIIRSITRFGEHRPYAVRSSATSEDSPTASFAGLFDTQLNVVGLAAVLRQIRRCWASLFSERAVTYRLQHGFDHRSAHMAVVVQEMVFAESAGVLFTADPVTSDRKVTCVEATFGLGEPLVSGRAAADVYRVRNGGVVARNVATKRQALSASPGGGTRERAIGPERQNAPALSDARIVELAALGRQLEAHFGHPQDIEWCLVDDGFRIVQCRPITTLFPVPVVGDGGNHVYVSVGHQQMMTDPMKPLGLSLWQLTTPRPMSEAGGRLFVDVTEALASSGSRASLVEALGRSDPLIGDALRTVLERDDFLPLLPDEGAAETPGDGPPTPGKIDAGVVAELIGRSEASVAAMAADIGKTSGSALLDFIVADVAELKRILFDPQSLQVITAAMDASRWLNDHLRLWLGERNAADALTQSVPHNVTSQMGLALLDVADAVRPYPGVVDFLRHVEDEAFLDDLETMAGGRAARDAIRSYLDRYGMRCVGEIDITRPRWSERPTTLVPLILANVRDFPPGAAARRFEQGRRKASEKEQEMLARLRELPDGARKAEDTRQMIDRVRMLIGYREYPKYGMVSRYYIYKQALLEEANRLVRSAVLREKDDIYYLTLQELDGVVRTQQVDHDLISQRRAAFRSYQGLTPPRVLTSDGEVVAGAYRHRDLPTGALVGLPVSAGTIEGRARVVLDMAAADLEAGDILVTTYTDPSWSALFVAIAGLVTEVGGLMTHGSVIAREYGIPAVVGVEHATGLIRDGQRIRVHGGRGTWRCWPRSSVTSRIAAGNRRQPAACRTRGGRVRRAQPPAGSRLG